MTEKRRSSPPAAARSSARPSPFPRCRASPLPASVTGPAARRRATRIPTSWSSTSASRATRSATRRSSGCTPACCGPRARPGTAVGRYLVWSDIPNDVQLRWLEEDGHVSVLRQPGGQQQRQHLRLPGPADLLRARQPPRRALRAQRHGHRAGRQLERQAAQRAQRRGRASRRRHLVHRPRLRQPDATTKGHKGALEIKEAVYRIDPKTGKIEQGHRRRSFKPNGLCFSPDYKKLYVADTGGAHYRRTEHQGLRRGRRREARERPRASLSMEFRRQDGRRRRHPLPTSTATSGPAPAGSATATTASTSSRPTARASARSCCRRSAQRLLRRRQAQPPVHDRQPVALRGLHRGPGRVVNASRPARPLRPTRRTGS